MLGVCTVTPTLLWPLSPPAMVSEALSWVKRVWEAGRLGRLWFRPQFARSSRNEVTGNLALHALHPERRQLRASHIAEALLCY